MEIQGILQMILPETRGESARGPWVRGGFVIETEEQYPRKIAFTTFGEDRVAAVKSVPIGHRVRVVFNIESREFNERWYTDCRCSMIEIVTSAAPQAAYGQPQQVQYQQPQPAQYVAPQQPQMPAQPQVQYQQPPVQPQQPQPMAGGTIEQDAMGGDDDLPF